MSNKIWIVDDDEAILDVIQIVLDQEGLESETIQDAQVIYERLKTERPQLILLDVLMSGIDGRDVSQHIKKDKKTTDIPIIIMTADIRADDKAKEAMADDFIRKPFDIDELVALVKKHLKS